MAEVAFRRQARISSDLEDPKTWEFSEGNWGSQRPKNGVFDICGSENLFFFYYLFWIFFLSSFWNFNDCRWVFR